MILQNLLSCTGTPPLSAVYANIAFPDSLNTRTAHKVDRRGLDRDRYVVQCQPGHEIVEAQSVRCPNREDASHPFDGHLHFTSLSTVFRLVDARIEVPR